MTVKKLKKILSDLPDHIEVMLDNCCGEFKFDAVDTVGLKEIGFSEEPGGEILAKDNVLVITGRS